jgi:hypothetical protein
MNNIQFLSGNKGKVKMALPFHQVEATQDALSYYLTNENFVRKPLIVLNNCSS